MLPEKADRKQNTLSGKGECVFLALGSNLGDRAGHLENAIAGLKAGGFCVEKVSSFYETPPVDCEAGTGPFLNGVLQGIWQGSAESLLDLCQNLERQEGRPEIHSSRQSRTLDLDLILFGGHCIHTGRLIIPHPRAQIRQFVLKGLVMISPDIVFPDSGKTASDLLAERIAKEGEL